MTWTPRKRGDAQGGEAERAQLPDPARGPPCSRNGRSSHAPSGRHGRYSPRLSGARQGEAKRPAGCGVRGPGGPLRSAAHAGDAGAALPWGLNPRSALRGARGRHRAAPCRPVLGSQQRTRDLLSRRDRVLRAQRDPAQGGRDSVRGGCRGPSPEAGCSEGAAGSFHLDSARPPALGLWVRTQATRPSPTPRPRSRGPQGPPFPTGTAFHRSPHLLSPARLVRGPRHPEAPDKRTGPGH